MSLYQPIYKLRWFLPTKISFVQLVHDFLFPGWLPTLTFFHYNNPFAKENVKWFLLLKVENNTYLSVHSGTHNTTGCEHKDSHNIPDPQNSSVECKWHENCAHDTQSAPSILHNPILQLQPILFNLNSLSKFPLYLHKYYIRSTVISLLITFRNEIVSTLNYCNEFRVYCLLLTRDSCETNYSTLSFSGSRHPRLNQWRY